MIKQQAMIKEIFENEYKINNINNTMKIQYQSFDQE